MNSARAAISEGPGQTIFIIAVIIALVMMFYYLYQWLYKGGDLSDYILYVSADSGLKASPTSMTNQTFTSGNVPGIYTGGEYSVSTWIYVQKWTNTSNKVFLTLSGGTADNNTLVLYLGKSSPKLGVRLSYTNSTSNSAYYPAVASITGSNTPSVVGTEFADSANNKCDVDEVSLQKWVNVTVVLSGRTTDVYIDGKLVRSCVNDSVYLVSGSTPTVTLGNINNGFTGLIGKTRVANFAYSPDVVYKNYLSGPYDTSLLSLMWNYINPASYSVSIHKN